VAPATGFIKWWRQTWENGHFNMPHLAFKLWGYFLTRAAYEPQPKWGIEVGELWVSYESLQDECSEKERPTDEAPKKRLSRGAIAKALKYLEDGEYIKRVHLGLGKGMKIRVINYQRYQTPEAAPGLMSSLPSSLSSSPSELASEHIQESIKKDKEDIGAVPVGPTPAKPKRKRKETPTDPRIKIVLDHYVEGFELTFGTKPVIPNYAQAGSLAKKLLAVYDVDKLDDLLYQFFHTDDKWVQEKTGYTFPAFCYTVTKLLTKGGRKQ
jgi:hypothetical protein